MGGEISLFLQYNCIGGITVGVAVGVFRELTALPPLDG